jgi:hypothetical protein
MLASFAAALLVVQAQPQAKTDWRLTAITGSAGQQSAYFADRSSIRRTDSAVWIDELEETEQPDATGNTANRVRMEYDCRLRAARVLATQTLNSAGTMIVVSDPANHLSPILIDTPDEERLRFACRETRGLGAVRDDVHSTALRIFESRASLLRAYPGRRPALSSGR